MSNEKKSKKSSLEVRIEDDNGEDVKRKLEVDDSSINTGFDRGIDFADIKQELIDAYECTIGMLNLLTEETKSYNGNERKLVNRLMYILIAMIQLINGSRISEACNAFHSFIGNGDLDRKIVVKLAKSETIKYKADGDQFKTKIRYRKIIFPKKWIDNPLDKLELMQYYLDRIEPDMLRKRVLDYLLKRHECNTHSLRYAYINYMIYDQKNEPSLIAKHVGHSNLNQLIRYTQNKQADKLFDIDI
jgi:hypothetical protein